MVLGQLLVGVTADKLYFLALGGNQNDAVSIAPILVSEVKAVRWPDGYAQLRIPLPVMPKTTTIAREA